MDNTDLEKLRHKYPTWHFSLHWYDSPSGPDKCLFVAKRGYVTLSAWIVSDLGAQVLQAQTEMGE